jgi:hypothetical protein
LRLRESGGIGEGCNDSASKYTKIRTIRFKLNEKQTNMNESHVCGIWPQKKGVGVFGGSVSIRGELL